MATFSDSDLPELQETLRKQIEFLRHDFKETISRYQSNVEAEMVNLMTQLKGKTTEDQSPACRNTATLRFLIEVIKSSKYKKDKGRLKDLRRIHDVIQTLVNRFGE
jgi:hypothetical protein